MGGCIWDKIIDTLSSLTSLSFLSIWDCGIWDCGIWDCGIENLLKLKRLITFDIDHE